MALLALQCWAQERSTGISGASCLLRSLCGLRNKHRILENDREEVQELKIKKYNTIGRWEIWG